MPNFEESHSKEHEENNPESKESSRSIALEKANELLSALSQFEEIERKESPDKTKDQQLREVALRLIIESLRGKNERVANMAQLIANLRMQK